MQNLFGKINTGKYSIRNHINYHNETFLYSYFLNRFDKIKISLIMIRINRKKYSKSFPTVLLLKLFPNRVQNSLKIEKYPKS
jgi:hypothetical protein